MCFIDDGDSATVWRETSHRAAKAHKCAECSREIQPGERYWSVFAIWDGDPGTYKTCAHCRVGQDWLKRNCGGFMHQGLLEEMEEHAEEYPHLALGLLRIKVGIRRRWRRFDGAGLMPVQHAPRDVSVAEPA